MPMLVACRYFTLGIENTFSVFAFCGCLTPAGIGGVDDVGEDDCDGSSRSCFPSIWPMKPAAPVMGMCIFIEEKIICNTRWSN